MSQEKTSVGLGEGLSGIAWVILIALCLGDPDILDGLIKRANEPGCLIQQALKVE